MVPDLMFLSERVSQLSITDLKVCYKQRTAEEVPLQSIQSPRKTWMIPIYNVRKPSHAAAN